MNGFSSRKSQRKEAERNIANALLTPNQYAFERSERSERKSQFASIVGNTTFTESRNIAKMVPCERLFLKFEGNNPTGTQKDRIALALAQASTDGYSGIAAATCGNFGAALAYAAHYFNIPDVHIYIPKGYHVPLNRMKVMTQYGAKIHYVEGTYEETVFYSSDMARTNNWYNANPGCNGTSEVSIEAYSAIAVEIYRHLKKAPDFVACPVGNGTTLAGIHAGFKELLNAKKITHLPRIIACSTRRGNPIIKSYKMKSTKIVDLNPNEITETKINEPLTNWHSFDGQQALNALYESEGIAEYASDQSMMEYSKLLGEEEGLNVMPASASTLAVLSKLTNHNIPLKGTYVCILTGRKMQ